MSGTTRPLLAPFWFLVASESGTTPRWYQGWRNNRLVPPPEPYRKAPGAGGVHTRPSSVLLPVSHPVSNILWPSAAMPRVVPPTAVTHWLDAEKSGDGMP